MKKFFVIPLLLFVSACSMMNDTSHTPQDEIISMGNDPNSELQDQQQMEKDQLEEPQKQTEEADLTPEPDETEHADPFVEKTYMMNENYIIIPKDEEANKKVILLTFDDGPKEEDMVSKMLEVLAKHEAYAIFFVNGYRVEQNPELLQMIYNAGHAIGNHSWDHINLREQNEETIDQQVEKVQTIVKELTGEAPMFFRPPHGAGNDYLKEKVKEEGMLYMTWSTSPEDWVKENQTAEMIVKNTLERVHSGANLLMHELPWTVEALDDLLTELDEAGYSFVHPKAIETKTE